jgi:hypothetical protein
VNTKRAFLTAALLVLLPASLAFAGGFGGCGFGYQLYDEQLSSANINMSCIMGYGYGTGWDGSRVGGFGMSLLSMTGEQEGGVGGVLAGHEWRARGLVAAFMVYAGVGGIGVGDSGYMVGFGEADFELGLRIFPWMEAVAYAGFQGWGNLIPGPAFHLATFYSPVVGIRLGWGGR